MLSMMIKEGRGALMAMLFTMIAGDDNDDDEVVQAKSKCALRAGEEKNTYKRHT